MSDPTLSVPRTMSAVVLTGHGGLDKLEHRTDWPVPVPAAGDVLVRVGACGLNNTDINTRTAWYSDTVSEGITTEGGAQGFAAANDAAGTWGGKALTFPRVQGADVSGRIAAVGAGVDDARIGERVMIDPWLLNADTPDDPAKARYFGSEVDGGFAEYTRAPTGNAIAVRSDLSDAELATFPCAYTTAENLIARTGLGQGETVVISGASGGVGSAAVQLCKLRGARVIAIAAAAKHDLLAELGADDLIDRNVDDLAAALCDIVPDGRLDVALDVVGGDTFSALVEALRPGGRYSSSGAISGPMVNFDLRQLIYKDLQFTGATTCPAGTMQRIVSFIEAGKLKPLLAATYPLADLAQAQTAFMEKRHVGNIVVVP